MSSQRVFLGKLKASLSSLSARALTRLVEEASGGCSRDPLAVRGRRRLLEKALGLAVSERLPRCQASDEYDAEGLVTEAVVGALEFAANRGFSCREIAAFLELFVTCLELVAAPENDLMTALKDFKEQIETFATKLSAGNLAVASGYIIETVFQHFRLYQYLLCQSQPVDLTSFKLSLDAPSVPRPLVEGVTALEWERKRRITELRGRQDIALRELLEEGRQGVEADEIEFQEAYESQLSGLKNSALTEDDVSKVIDSLGQAHMSKAQRSVSLRLKHSEMEVSHAVERLELLLPGKAEEKAAGHSSSSSPGKSGRQSRATLKKSPRK